MPYKTTWRPGGVIWTFSGVFTGEDAIQANLDIYGDPRFDDLRYQIVDISQVERFNLPNEAVETAAAMDEAATLSNPRLIVAVVAPTGEALKAAESYKSAMSESRWKVRIFCSMEDAREWVRPSCGR
ncbi:MAG: hypothetical protein AB1916_13835 [Thermodesulfobacteriota bacterium]